MDVVRTIRRALALIDQSARRRLGVLAFCNVLAAGFDALAILLLVPFLGFLGNSVAPAGFGVRIAEQLLPGASSERIVLVLALLATLLFIVKGISSVILLWVQTGVLNSATVDLQRRLLQSFTRAPWLVQQSSGTGELLRTVSGSVSSTMTVVAGMLGVVSEGAVFLAIVTALIIINPMLAIGALIYLVLAGLVYLRVVRRPIETRGLRLQVEGQRMNSSLIELVSGIKELTIRGSASTYLDRYTTAGRSALSAYRLIVVTNQGMRYLLEVLMITGAALVIGVATLSGSATTVLVSIGVLLAGGLRLLPALNTLLIAVNNVRANEPAVAIVEAELARLAVPDEIVPPLVGEEGGAAPIVPSGAFALEQVGFRYPTREQPALSGISIDVAFGEALGIVGATGSGKSTFVDLLLGFLQPTEGAIRIDGEPLLPHLASWRAQIGFVPQDIFLVDDTLAANITFGEVSDTISQEQLAEAITLAQLDDVVAELPEGVDTMLGERGVRLSGGAAPACWARASALSPTARIDPRRGYLCPRQRDRAAHQRRTAHAARPVDNDRDRPPTLDRTLVRPHPLPRRWSRRGPRHLRRVGSHQRGLCAPRRARRAARHVLAPSLAVHSPHGTPSDRGGRGILDTRSRLNRWMLMLQCLVVDPGDTRRRSGPHSSDSQLQ